MYVSANYPSAISLDSYAEAVGGAQYQAHRVARHLGDHIHVRVLSQRPPGGPECETLDDVKIHRVPISMRGGTRGAVTALLQLVRAALLEPDVDVIQAFQLNAITIAAGLAATLRRKPLAIKITGRDNFDRLSGMRGRFQLRCLVRMASAFIAPSHSCMDAAVSAGVPLSAVHYIPNGVETAYFLPPKPAEKAAVRRKLGYASSDFVFCWIGRLHPLKGLDCVGPAWETVVARHAHARLLIVGDGEEEAIAQTLVDAFPSVQRLHFRDDVRPFYACSDAILLTSRSEGLSNVLLEGMASGLPAVVSAVPENAEAGPGGNVLTTFNREDPASLAQALIQAMESSSAAPSRGSAARKHVEANYSLVATAEKWRGLYMLLSSAYC